MSDQTITENELTHARKVWGDALIAVSKAYEEDGIESARQIASEAIDAAYGYNFGPVLFKPTLASGEYTFRPTREGALAYFVGHSEDYPLDGGFGIKGWRQVECETSASFIQGDVAMWMGWVTFTDKDGNVTKVDKSWGYKKDDEETNANLTISPMFAMKSNLSWDIPASIVVFLVALPLCLGIALASGAPPIAGLIAGVIGGLVVGSLSGSSLGVSGPAAGLAVIVYNGIETMPTFEIFALAVVIGGVVQVLLGLARAGVLALFVPTSVVSGMLAAIGIIICLKQLPHAVGYDEEPEGSLQFVTDSSHNTVSNLLQMFDNFQPTATLISIVGLGLLLLWEAKFIKSKQWSHLVPAPLLVVVMGVLVYHFTKGTPWELSPDHLVQIPLLTDGQGLSTFFTFPDFSAVLRMDVWKLGITLAIVASIETLLCVDATDKLDPQHRQTPTNRELFAQGTGNICSGLVGGLPITQVIVRSSANIQSNAKSKLSAILHGVWLIVTILAIPSILNMIPLASLAAILLVVGYKLAKPATFMKMAKKGHHQFFPFIVTVLAIVFTDLLIGIGIGLTVALIYILWNHFSRPTDRVEKDDENKTYTIHLCSDVTFLHRLGISKTIADVPDDYHIYVDTQNTNSIDPDVQEVLVDLQSKAASKGRKFEILTKQTSD